MFYSHVRRLKVGLSDSKWFPMKFGNGKWKVESSRSGVRLSCIEVWTVGNLVDSLPKHVNGVSLYLSGVQWHATFVVSF